jgi:hypothetical protein
MSGSNADRQLAIPMSSEVTCASGHLFRPRRDEPPSGCQACGAQLVDWHRVWRRDVDDWPYIFSLLPLESIRQEYWNGEIDSKALESRPSSDELLDQLARRRLKQSVSKVYGTGSDARPYRDGYQTPKQGSILYYAQHSLACCCRRCMRYWHGIPYGRPLREDELDYFVALIGNYVDTRLSMPTQAARRSRPD